jgi:hypothetical protein
VVRSKKRSKGFNFYLSILDSIKVHNKLPKPSDLKISKQAMNPYVRKLKIDGIIEKIGYGTWRLKDKIDTRKYISKLQEVKQFSMGLRVEKPETNLHSLQITIPILLGRIEDKDWELKNKLNNWLPKYKKLEILGGLTIRNNNNKSITIWAKSRNIKSLEDVDNLAFKIKAYINEYFKNKWIILDIFNTKTTNLNLATSDKNAESMIRKGEKFELDLMKKAEKIFPKDNINAKAWIDGSPFKFSAESNDKEWKREYLSMPFRILNMFSLLETMTDSMSYVAENYKSHVKMVEESSKLFKRFNKLLSQKKLKDFNFK